MTVRILVSYDGEWVESPEAGIFKFNGSKGKGMSVPKNTKYQELLDKVCRLLMVDSNEFSISMKVLYASSVPVPPAEIVNDDDVSFFISENSSNVSLRTPLCVTLARKSSPVQQMTYGEGSSQTVNVTPETQEEAFVPVVNLTRIEENLPDFSVDNEFGDDDFGTSSAELAAGDALVEPQLVIGHPRSSDKTTVVDPPALPGLATPATPSAANSHSFQRRASQGPVEWVTTREALAACTKDAVTASTKVAVTSSTEEPLSPSSVNHSWELGTRHVFSSKKELQEKLSILAIKENFEFKVKRSTKKLLAVECVEEGCEWQLRAVVVRHSTSFRIRKFVKDHSCSNKARGSVHHRQASSWLISQHIKSKCQDSNQTYKPREIIEDIQKELGLNLSYEKAWRAREKALYSNGGTPRPHPTGSKKVGRPKKQRIQLGEEVERTRNSCGKCGKLGHNRKTCSANTELHPDGASGGTQDTAPNNVAV